MTAYYETHEPPHCPTCGCGFPCGGILWIEPDTLEGVMIWPMCEAKVTDPTGTRNRDDDDHDCRLTAKIDYHGKMLCQRHAAKLLLREFVKKRATHPTREGL